MHQSLLAIVSALLFCCSPAVSDSTSNWFTADYSMMDLPVSASFTGPETKGTLQNTQIDEASGLAVSRANPGHVWTHNDSGDFNRIFLVGPSGEDRATFRLIHTGNRDWEDMAIGPGPVHNVHYLYIADIGDNLARNDIKRIFRVPEPDASDFDTDQNLVDIEGSAIMQFRYPDGMKDAETVMIDPLTRDLYIVSKREYPVTVYVARYPQPTDSVFEAEILGKLPFTDVTAGDISADGTKILMKTKTHVFMWERALTESIAAALQRQPVRLPYVPEPQGEAIAWTPEGDGYYVLSESRSVPPVLYFYRAVNE